MQELRKANNFQMLSKLGEYPSLLLLVVLCSQLRTRVILVLLKWGYRYLWAQSMNISTHEYQITSNLKVIFGKWTSNFSRLNTVEFLLHVPGESDKVQQTNSP